MPGVDYFERAPRRSCAAPYLGGQPCFDAFLPLWQLLFWSLSVSFPMMHLLAEVEAVGSAAAVGFMEAACALEDFTVAAHASLMFEEADMASLVAAMAIDPYPAAPLRARQFVAEYTAMQLIVGLTGAQRTG